MTIKWDHFYLSKQGDGSGDRKRWADLVPSRLYEKG